MMQVRCIQKFRDSTGKIYGYRVQDINGVTQDVRPENLKQAIRNNQIRVVNLTLTSDNRLVDSKEHILQDKSLGKAPEKQETYKEKLKSWFNGIAQYAVSVFGTGDVDIVDLATSNGKTTLMVVVFGVDYNPTGKDERGVEIVLDMDIEGGVAKAGGCIGYIDGAAIDIDFNSKPLKSPIMSDSNTAELKAMIDKAHAKYLSWKSDTSNSPLNAGSSRVIEAINKATGAKFELSCSGKYTGNLDYYAYYDEGGQELVIRLGKMISSDALKQSGVDTSRVNELNPTLGKFIDRDIIRFICQGVDTSVLELNKANVTKVAELIKKQLA